MKHFLTILSLFVVLFIGGGEAHANIHATGSSAMFKSEIREQETDYRSNILRGYLESYNSPLAEEADTFVSIADKYNLDWRLLASIASG